MTTYYVSPYGLDANNGLGSDPAHASNKPWLTIGKALGATGIASGDTVKICPGVYRQVVTVNMTSATVETFVTGDYQNTSGFKDGSGNLVAGGTIAWSAYTTNDKTAPSTTTTLTLNGRDFLSFSSIIFIGANNTNPSCVSGVTTNSVNIKFTECLFIPGASSSVLISYTGLADVASNWLIDRCIFSGSVNGQIVLLTLPTSAIADYDSNFVVQDTRFIGGTTALRVTTSGALTFKPGGVDILNCTMLAQSSRGIQVSGTTVSTSIPCTAYNNVIIGAPGGCLDSGATGQLIEDYNILYSATTRLNVTAGANSQASTTSLQYALLMHHGEEILYGMSLRPFFSPMSGSPFLGFGNQAGGPTVDLWNRIRPAGGLHGSYGVGDLECHDSWVKETTTTDAGGVAISITGPGDHDFKIPVDAASTTISIKMRRDTTYGEGTGLPQAILLANGEIGFAGETKTMTAADDTWDTLTFAAFTPTQKGVVTLRVVSRDTTATGKTFADTVVVA